MASEVIGEVIGEVAGEVYRDCGCDRSCGNGGCGSGSHSTRRRWHRLKRGNIGQPTGVSPAIGRGLCGVAVSSLRLEGSAVVPCGGRAAAKNGPSLFVDSFSRWLLAIYRKQMTYSSPRTRYVLTRHGTRRAYQMTAEMMIGHYVIRR